MRKLALPAAAALVAALAACQPVGQAAGYGEIGMAVRFPTPGFRVAMIPDTTASIGIEISGTGMTSPLKATISRSGTTATGSFVKTVPIGAKTITATAFDRDGKALAIGQGQATVVLNTRTTATVTLAPVPDPSASPSASPSPGDSPTPAPVVSTTPAPANTPIPTPTLTPTPLPTATATPVGSAGTLPTPTPTPTVDPEVGTITVTNGSVPAMGGQDL